MPKRRNRSRVKRRKSRLSATNAGPILAFGATVLGILALVALILFVALPNLLPLIGVEFNPPWQPTPTPAPSVRPTPTPHPISHTDPMDIQHEVVLSGYDQYRWFADPYANGDRLLFSAGRLVGSDIHMDALFSWNMRTNEQEKIGAELANTNYISPVCNDTWLVYLDAAPTGGGVIRAMRWDTGKMTAIKTVYTGQPRLHLDGDHLAWMERTGSTMDKLFVCDLNTLENTTLYTFNNSPYGQSQPSISKGRILFADLDIKAEENETSKASTLVYISLEEGKLNSYAPGTVVHDPMTNGKQWIWRNGYHGFGDDLYMAVNQHAPQLIAEDIIEYGISDQFAAYSKDESIYVYLFDSRSAYQITPEVERERTQLLGVSDNVVIWMDVTSRERDILKYARID